MRRKWYLIAPAAIAGIIVFAFLGGEVVKLLWNWLLPPLFGFRQLTFWQAFGLLALSRILFGGWGRGGGRGWGRDRARRRMLERWSRMTPEERERFREDMRRCGGWRYVPDDAPAAAPKADRGGRTPDRRAAGSGRDRGAAAKPRAAAH